MVRLTLLFLSLAAISALCLNSASPPGPKTLKYFTGNFLKCPSGEISYYVISRTYAPGTVFTDTMVKEGKLFYNSEGVVSENNLMLYLRTKQRSLILDKEGRGSAYFSDSLKIADQIFGTRVYDIYSLIAFLDTTNSQEIKEEPDEGVFKIANTNEMVQGDSIYVYVNANSITCIALVQSSNGNPIVLPSKEFVYLDKTICKDLSFREYSNTMDSLLLDSVVKLNIKKTTHYLRLFFR